MTDRDALQGAIKTTLYASQYVLMRPFNCINNPICFMYVCSWIDSLLLCRYSFSLAFIYMSAPRIPVAVAQPISKAKPAPAAAVIAPPGGSPIISAAAAAPVPSVSSHSHSNSDELDARLILDMPLSRVYQLKDGTKHLVTEGTLEVLQSRFDGRDVYVLVLDGVKLALRLEVPCLEMAPRNFVFPTDSVTYGLVVADTVDADVLDVFRILLSEHTSFRSAAAPQPISSLPDVVKEDKVVGVANSVAAGLGAGSVVVATGVIRGGKLLGGVIVRGGEYLASKLTPNAEPTKVSQASKDRLAKAKFVSGAACKVSKALVIGAMATTEIMAKQLSDALKETDIGKKIASDPVHPQPRLDAAKHVGKSAIGAVLNVYTAIETAVFGVASDVSTATVTVVKQKYGAEAGAHTEASLGVAGQVAVATHQVNQIGVKSIVKKTAIKASQEILTTPSERAAAEKAKQDAAAAEGPGVALKNSIGQAMGLPAGVDPLVAMEAAAAVAQLSQASNAIISEQKHSAAAAAASAGPVHTPSISQSDIVVTTATATGTSPAAAQARATQAANAGARAAVAPAVAQPVKK
jgi:hypothetical protein